MKINFVIPSTVLGGGVRVVFQYANFLTYRGHDVVIYVPKIFWPNHEGIPNLKTSIANTIKRRKKVPWFSCDFKIELATLISNKYIRDADATIATAWYTAKDVYNLNENKGKKFYFIQDYEVANDGADREQVEKTYTFPMKKIVIAKWLEKVVYDISKEHSKIIQNGIPDSEFIDCEKKHNTKKTVIMLGNMAEHKGGKNGLEILKDIQQRYDIRVIIFAAFPVKNLPETFEFYLRPERKKLMNLYEQSDICLFPSMREGWGLIVTEAMAQKCAVVGNNTGAVSEIGIAEKNMLINYDFTNEGLKKLIVRLVNDEELLIKIQNGGFETAKEMKQSIQNKKFEEFLLKEIEM